MKRNIFLSCLVIFYATIGSYAMSTVSPTHSVCGIQDPTRGSYLEMKITTAKNGLVGNMKIYSQEGNYRAEISFVTDENDSQAVKHNLAVLILKDNHDTGYILDEGQKTYSKIDVSQKDDNKKYALSDYDVTVLGKERVNNYNATHVKIENKKANFEEEMWTTTQMAGFLDSGEIKSIINSQDNMSRALAEKGAAGLTVRIVVPKLMKGNAPECSPSAKLFRVFVCPELGVDSQIDLVKAEKCNNPLSLFSLEKYTQSIGENGVTDTQNMTPEQAKQFIEMMKRQINGPH